MKYPQIKSFQEKLKRFEIQYKDDDGEWGIEIIKMLNHTSFNQKVRKTFRVAGNPLLLDVKDFKELITYLLLQFHQDRAMVIKKLQNIKLMGVDRFYIVLFKDREVAKKHVDRFIIKHYSN